MTEKKKAPLVILAGPTGSGKSALALELAEYFSGTIINADSLQVYQELSVLTSRPPASALARVPHELYGVLSVRESCSVGRWRGWADEAIARARAANRLPILVGGTGLYLRGFLKGLAPMPAVSPECRAGVQADYDSLGPQAFHAELARVDAQAAQRLHPHDRQRVTRAMEIFRATGKPFSQWLARPHHGAEHGAEHGAGNILPLLLLPSRAALCEAIDARFGAMVANGAIDEARAIMGLNLDPGLPALKALGLRELMAHLCGTITLDEAITKAGQATRRYAKRQVTWFKHQLEGAETFPLLYRPADPGDPGAEIRHRLGRFLLTLEGGNV